MTIILLIDVLIGVTVLLVGAGRAIAGARFERALRAMGSMERGALVPLPAVDAQRGDRPDTQQRSA